MNFQDHVSKKIKPYMSDQESYPQNLQKDMFSCQNQRRGLRRVPYSKRGAVPASPTYPRPGPTKQAWLDQLPGGTPDRLQPSDLLLLPSRHPHPSTTNRSH